MRTLTLQSRPSVIVFTCRLHPGTEPVRRDSPQNTRPSGAALARSAGGMSILSLLPSLPLNQERSILLYSFSLICHNHYPFISYLHHHKRLHLPALKVLLTVPVKRKKQLNEGVRILQRYLETQLKKDGHESDVANEKPPF